MKPRMSSLGPSWMKKARQLVSCVEVGLELKHVQQSRLIRSCVLKEQYANKNSGGMQDAGQSHMKTIGLGLVLNLTL